MILKVKRKIKRERKKGRKEKEDKEGKEEYWFGDILLFVVVFYRSKVFFVDSNFIKS